VVLEVLLEHLQLLHMVVLKLVMVHKITQELEELLIAPQMEMAIKLVQVVVQILAEVVDLVLCIMDLVVQVL
jgi:hypothetical protein